MDLFKTFLDPPRKYTLMPFWFLNDDLKEDELQRQIDDFYAHGVYGFTPHCRIGLPESIQFLGDRYFHFMRFIVGHAAKKGMQVILYDEAMYPSGSASGKVVAANPRNATRCLKRRPKGPLKEDEHLVAEDDKWLYVNAKSHGHIRGIHFGEDDGEPGAPPSGDLLSPESVATFLHVDHDKHYEELKEYFGKTIIGVFTDEPDVLGRGHIKGVLPWTWGFEDYLKKKLGYDMRPHFAALFDDKADQHDRYMNDFHATVNKRLQETFYKPYSEWCANHGVALTGHPALPGDIGVEKYFTWPGQDIVWRWVEPFNKNAIEGDQSTQAKCSSSAQHHYGRTRNLNECFGAFGWNLTYDETRWIANWLFVRGVNLMVPHAFFYSIRGKRHDERPPDVGPHNVWWDTYKTYADYCRRMCWLVAEGHQVCDIAILGSPTKLPWRAAKVLFQNQRDFNYLDTDTLEQRCTVTADSISVEKMRYSALIVDGREYATRKAIETLQPFAEAGRIIKLDEHMDDDALLQSLNGLTGRDVVVRPAAKDLRFCHLTFDGADIYVFSNEGKEIIDVKLKVTANTDKAAWWHAEKGKRLDGSPDRLQLPPIETRLLYCPKA